MFSSVSVVEASSGEAILRACGPEASSHEPVFASPERFPPENPKMAIMS